MIAPVFVAVALAAAAAQPATTTTNTTPVPESAWTVREQLQIPAMTANHVVGGLGFGVAFEKGPVALEAEGQVLPVVICDSSCGSAYAAGVGVPPRPSAAGPLSFRATDHALWPDARDVQRPDPHQALGGACANQPGKPAEVDRLGDEFGARVLGLAHRDPRRCRR